ncbi:MAG: hypothetical protein ACRD4E_04600 [Bryobacteraceae bacterium]
MKSEDWVIRALRALAENDREREASKEVEGRVLAVFRRRRGRRKARTVALATLAVAAGITLFFARPQPKQVAPSPAIGQRIAVAAVPVPAPQPEPKQTAKVVPARQPREVVTQFFPLLDAAPPFERGELLRVTVPASTMRQVGLPVNEDRLSDRVYADVLVGQEGLARAIRFVSYEQ